MTYYFRRCSTVEGLGFAAAAVSLYLGFTTFDVFQTGKWICLGLVALWIGRGRRLGALSRPFFRGAMAVVGCCAFSVTYSADPFRSAQLVVALSLIFLVVMLLLAGPTGRKGNRIDVRQLAFQVENLTWGYVLVAAIFFVPGMTCLVLGVSHPPFLSDELFTGLDFGRNVRFAGILGNPNQIGICAAVLSPVVFAKALERPSERILCWVLLGMIGYSVWISGSRNGLLSVVVGCSLVLVLAGYGNRVLRLCAVVVVLILVVMFNAALFEEYFTRSKGGAVIEEVAGNRLPRWTCGIESISKRPLLGQGYGVGGVPKSGFVEPYAVDTGYPLHNSYLQVTQEVGILGLVTVLLFVGCGVFLSLWRNPWIANSAALRHNFGGFAAAVVAGAFSAVFESWLLAPGNLATLPFWCAVGVVTSIAVFARRHAESTRRKSKRRIRPGMAWSEEDRAH